MARLGRIGLFTAPFMPQLPQPPRVPRNHPLHAAFQAQQSDRYRVIYRFTACNLCGVAGGDLVHMCTVCQHPPMVARREAALGGGKWAAHIISIFSATAAAHGRSGILPDHLREAAQAPGLPLSPEGIFITERVLTGSPWPASAVPPDWIVAYRLGTLFDKPINSSAGAIGRLADTWAGIAYTVLLDVCVGWCALLPDQERAALLAAGFRVRQHPAATGAEATPDPPPGLP